MRGDGGSGSSVLVEPDAADGVDEVDEVDDEGRSSRADVR